MITQSWLKRGNALGIFVITSLMGGGYAWGQALTLTEDHFINYATIYVSSFNLATGAMDFDWFEYQLSAESYPVAMYEEFEIRINSEALGLTY